MSEPLTPHQRAVIDEVHDDAKALMKTLSHGFSESIINTLTKIIGEVIKLVQAAKATKEIHGADKKRVVIEVIRLLIADIVEDEKERASILATFDEMAEASINVMIYVSHGMEEINQVRKQAEGALKAMNVEVTVVQHEAESMCGCLAGLLRA
jgi:hypothetical protein